MQKVKRNQGTQIVIIQVFTKLPRRMAFIFLLGLGWTTTHAETPQEQNSGKWRFGPYVVNSLSAAMTPFATDLSLPHLGYHFKLGWMEPIVWEPGSIFHATYFESIVKANITPYQADVGTAFNIKPLRFLDVGLSYNRLQFLKSRVTFASEEALPPTQSWRPDRIHTRNGGWGGADVFTFNLGLTVKMQRLTLLGRGTHALWDVKSRGGAYVFEYRNNMLIRTSDRINMLEAQAHFNLNPWAPISLKATNKYWNANRSGVEQNRIAAGFTGLRWGTNGRNEKRGLDLLLGKWTLHPHVSTRSLKDSFVLILDWSWDVRFLEI